MLLGSTQKFLRELHRIGAVKVDTKTKFKLALHKNNPNAPLSPFYIDLRIPENKSGPLQARHVESIATELLQLASRRHINFDAIAGIPRAGTPFAEKMVQLTKDHQPKYYIPLHKRTDSERAMRVRKYSIKHIPASVKRVLVVDDLVTKADTKLIAIKALQRAGYEIVGIVVYIDREQGGLEEIRRLGIPIYAVVKATQMFNFFQDKGLVVPADVQECIAYIQH